MTDPVIYDYLDDPTGRIVTIVAAVCAAGAGILWAVVYFNARRRERQLFYTPPPGNWNVLAILAIMMTVFAVVGAPCAAYLQWTAHKVRGGKCATVAGPVEAYAMTYRSTGRSSFRVFTFTVAGQPLELKDRAGEKLQDGLRVRVDHLDGEAMRIVKMVDE